DPPELKRAKENQKNISNVYYRGQLGRATTLSVTPEMERVKKNQENISSVKYTQDHKQMKGRPSLILDTPAMRHVKEAQNHISMVGSNQIILKTC
ncbi:nebulette, partial [Homo sapiens]